MPLSGVIYSCADVYCCHPRSSRILPLPAPYTTLRRGNPTASAVHSPHRGNGGGNRFELGGRDGGCEPGGDGASSSSSLNAGAASSLATAAAAAGRVGAARDDFSARGHSVRHDYFGGEEGDEEERSLLGGGGGGGGGGGEGGEGGVPGGAEGDVFSMVPGSTMSMFLEVGGWVGERDGGAGNPQRREG